MKKMFSVLFILTFLLSSCETTSPECDQDYELIDGVCKEKNLVEPLICDQGFELIDEICVEKNVNIEIPHLNSFDLVNTYLQDLYILEYEDIVLGNLYNVPANYDEPYATPYTNSMLLIGYFQSELARFRNDIDETIGIINTYYSSGLTIGESGIEYTTEETIKVSNVVIEYVSISNEGLNIDTNKSFLRVTEIEMGFELGIVNNADSYNLSIIYDELGNIISIEYCFYSDREIYGFVNVFDEYIDIKVTHDYHSQDKEFVYRIYDEFYLALEKDGVDGYINFVDLCIVPFSNIHLFNQSF